MKTITIHQPQYFPWLGLVEKIAAADTFILLDNVQFNKRSFQNRAMYSTAQGGKYLTIPVYSKNYQEKNLQIKDLEFSEDVNEICNKHYETLRHRYGKTKGWKIYGEEIRFFYSRKYNNAYELIKESIQLTLNLFQIDKQIICASELNSKGTKNDLLIDIVKKVGGTIYLSGNGAKSYMNEELFKVSNIEVIYQQFTHPSYQQSHKGSFFEGALALDFLFECPTEAIAYMKGKVK